VRTRAYCVGVCESVLVSVSVCTRTRPHTCAFIRARTLSRSRRPQPTEQAGTEKMNARQREAQSNLEQRARERSPSRQLDWERERQREINRDLGPQQDADKGVHSSDLTSITTTEELVPGELGTHS